DFDEMIHAASANLKENQGTAQQFMVFVSTSMPEQALKRIIADTSAAGGVVVFRGFPGNSGKAFIAALSRVVEKDQQFASIGIDPRLFRAFDVTAVPTMVVSSSDFTPCDGLTCKTTPPPFDRIEGNVTVRYALETFAGENGPGALVARTALANLGRNP
ncbi:type-F conjugative transfer system pilin assembly protein TrbC, partial [Escherichia coli]|nr:type-F conjugative transfer system pilin assembly protein TrbC [Escherichia coli]